MERKLRNIRISKGLTQSQLGKMIGVSRATIARWELGTRDISMRWLKKLSFVLKVRISELIDCEGISL